MESNVNPPTVVESNSLLPEVQKCQALLAEGTPKVVTNQTDIVLVLGMTGSGKTTFVKFMSTNNDNLLSEEVGDNLGEYVITDADHKISSNAVISQTIFPELYIDPESQISFVDAPGFSDTRGLGVDMAGAYLLHEVIVSAPQIRFVLTVNYSSFRRGMDRADFLDFLKYLMRLVKNVDDYLESVVLVVTKVDNQLTRRDKTLVLVADETVVEYVAKFLVDFKDSIPKVVADRTIAENMSKLIDVLLRKKGSVYQKIALFRRPDQAGPLSNVQLLQTAKVAIKRVIRDNLTSARTNVDDFGYAISQESQNQLHELKVAINANITAQIANECRPKIGEYEARSAAKTDIYDEYASLRQDYEKVRDWLAGQSSDLDLGAFTNKLLEMSRWMAAPFSQAQMNRILAKGEHISLLEMVGETKIGDSSAWKRGLQAYFDYLRNTVTWYEVATEFYRLLSGYEAQSRVQNNYRQLSEGGKGETSADSLALLKEYNQVLDKKLKAHSGLEMDEVKLALANEMLESTLTPDTSIVYQSRTDTFEIRGKFVTLSSLVTNRSLWKGKYIEVFASEKLFVDVNVGRDGAERLQAVSLVAPTWEIVGDVEINLNGENGCCEPATAAKDGNSFWRTGANGRPGAPGQSAANFFGLATTVVNGHRLTIKANGGRGADGQDGGRGESGYAGASPITQTRWGSCTLNGDIGFFSSQKLGGFFRPVYCVYGKEGGVGGAGGDGGIGGYGGLAGKVRITLASGESGRVKIEAKDGPAGVPGIGGEGGAGGKAGRSWNHQGMMWWWREAECSRSKMLADEYSDCANTDYRRNGEPGERGTTGANREGVKFSQPSADVNIPLVMTKYEEFLQQSASNDTINRTPKIEFLKRLVEIRETLDQRVLPIQGRSKGLLSGRAKRSARLDQFDSRWVMKDCFRLQQWPITDRIAHKESTTESSITSARSTQFSVAETLVLTDLLVRKLNKSKPNYFKYCAVDYVKARHCALQLLSTFENILSSGDGDARVELDPVPIMEKLENEIINGGTRENIGKILIDSIGNESSERKADMYRRLGNALGIDQGNYS